MRLRKKYINAKLVCDIADAISNLIGDKSAKTFSRLLKKVVKVAPGIKATRSVPVMSKPVESKQEPQRKVLGTVFDFVSALRGDTRVIAELPSGEVVFDGYLDECFQEELENYDVTNIAFRNGVAFVSVCENEENIQQDFVIVSYDDDDGYDEY